MRFCPRLKSILKSSHLDPVQFVVRKDEGAKPVQSDMLLVDAAAKPGTDPTIMSNNSGKLLSKFYKQRNA
jgi:hypothetical protein